MEHMDLAVADLIATVPWGRLAHAYDVALDAPQRLRALAADVALPTEEGAREFCVWIDSAVVHQGTPYAATPPILWIARRILADASGPVDHPGLGACLTAVADCATTLHDAFGPGGGPGDVDGPAPVERNRAGEPPWAAYLGAGKDLVPAVDDEVGEDYFLAATPDVTALRTCLADWAATVAGCRPDGPYAAEADEADRALRLPGHHS